MQDQNKDFSMGEAIAFGYKKTLIYFWLFVTVFLTSAIIETPLEITKTYQKEAIPSAAILILYIVTMLAGIILNIGITNISIKIANNKKAIYSDLFMKAKLIWSYFLTSFLYGLLVSFGLILLIVPGVYWAIKYQFYNYLIVDKGMRPVEALKESARLTEGIRMPLLVFFFLVVMINILGLLLFGVGLFFTLPLTVIAYAFIYKELQKQIE